MEVITNLKVYDLEETLVSSGYAMINDLFILVIIIATLYFSIKGE